MVNQELVKEAIGTLWNEASQIEDHEEYQEVIQKLQEISEILQMN